MKILHSDKILIYPFFIIIFLFKFCFTSSKILNKIIRLGDNPFRYNHFSFTEAGDMFVDTEDFPSSKIRKFFAIKKDGTGYFSYPSGNRVYQTSMTLNYEKGRIEGESCFVKTKSSYPPWNGREFLFGVSIAAKNDYRTEFYDIFNSKVYSDKTKDLFGEITSYVFSILPDPLNTNSEFNYFISYIAETSENTYKLFTKKINFIFNFHSDISIIQDTLYQINAVNQRIISCFFTDNHLYICFYTNEDLQLAIWVFDPLTKKDNETYIYKYNQAYERRFYKGIHLKGEIGFFAYFKENSDMPTFSLYQVGNNKKMAKYKAHYDIQANQGSFYNIDMLNDLIKLNNNTVCFVSSTLNKTGLNILVFSLYDKDIYINIRYYIIDLWGENTIKFYAELRLSLFNYFLVMAFSHCDQEICDENNFVGYNHYSSLIFFNYPNITKTTFDLLEYIYSTNKKIENEININFEEFLVVENNLFGYVYKGIKVISYSNTIDLVVNGEKVESGNIIYNNESMIFKFKSVNLYSAGDYNIEFAYVISEPNYGTDNDYMIYLDDTKGNSKKNEQPYFQQNEYIGKNMDLKVILSKSLTTNCDSDICSLCYYENKDICMTCKYNFDFNSETNNKTCHEFQTENIIQIQPTTQNPGEIQTTVDIDKNIQITTFTETKTENINITTCSNE